MIDFLDFLAFYVPPLSYALGGAFGGLLYVLLSWWERKPVTVRDLVARPVFGAVAAVVLTVGLGLPNHFTSLFAGYAGISVWHKLVRRFAPDVPENPAP